MASPNPPPNVVGVALPTGTKLYIWILLVVDVVACVLLVAATLVTGHDLNDATVQRFLGYGVTIAVLLGGLVGISGQVQDAHSSLSSRLDQLVATTAYDAFAQGQQAVAPATSISQPADTSTTAVPPA